MTKSNRTREWLVDDVGLKLESVDEVCRQILSFSHNEKAFRGSARLHEGYMGTGNRKAEVMIVSGIPSESEQRSRMVGLADYATALTIMFNQLGMEFGDLYWTLAYKDDDAPSMVGLMNHRRYLQEEIISVNPSIIISLGNVAISTLLGEKLAWDEVMEDEGYNVHDNLPDIPIISLQHPDTFIEEGDVESFKEFFTKSWAIIKEAIDH